MFRDHKGYMIPIIITLGPLLLDEGIYCSGWFFGLANIKATIAYSWVSGGERDVENWQVSKQ